MTDFIDVPASPPPSDQPPPPPPDNPDRPVCTPAEIEAGKVLAILCYALNFVFIPFFLIPLVMRSDRFSLYHAKQCLVLWIFGVPGLVVWKAAAALFTICTCGMGGVIAVPLFVAAVVGLWVLNIMGLINAVGGRCTPHWLIGPLGEKWFAGIRVEPKPGNPQ